MKKEALKYTVIYGGGAIRGISYIGALKALNELGVETQNLAGSSVGAIFAGLIAVGYSEEELKELFLEVNFDLFRDIHFGFGTGFALSKGEVFLDWIRQLIEKKYYKENYKKGENMAVTFADLDKNLVIITTDLTNFAYKEFSKKETPDFEVATAIRISSTMPGLMLPVKYNNSELVDGDLQKSWPLWRLSKNLCPDDERVLEFRLEGDYEGKGRNAIDFINTVYSCVTSVATNFIIDCYGEKDKFDYIKINTGKVIIVDFNQSREKRENLIKIGYEQTMNYFKEYLPNKKKTILKHYQEINKYLKKIKSLLNRNQVNRAKTEMGYLFMMLHKANKCIDKKDFNKIDLFRELFFKELNEPNIFGCYSRNGIKAVMTAVNELIEGLKSKEDELESFTREPMFV